MKSSRVLLGAFLVVLGVAGLAVAQAAGDPFMGDWQSAKGAAAPMVAQVIALGNGEYQANMLPEFDKRVPALAVLKGKLADNKVSFSGDGWTAVIDGDAFTGSDKNGSFALKKVVRLSPTLGEKPPAGAIVLFDGTSTEGWQHPESKNWMVNLKQATNGTDNCTAYLRTQLYSPKKQRVRIEMGSDDGLKAWLNGQVICENNVARGVKPGEDKAFVKLNEGWNVLMIKVMQGSGDWAVCAQVKPLLGDDVKGLRISPTGKDDGAATGPAARDFILDWEIAGPYTKSGVDGLGLGNVAFAPEEGSGEKAEWKLYTGPRGNADRSCRWKLVDGGAMQVFNGSLMTKEEFGDQKLHIEFRTPFMPDKRGQERGNSGVYIQGRYEIQVLDSYGLDGLDNECGGIYKNAAPLVNMCAPPLQWQSYDVTFHAAQVDATGKVTKKAVITVVQNGVTIHNNLEVDTTPGGCDYDMTQPGPLFLQDHGTPVEYRNIWIEKL